MLFDVLTQISADTGLHATQKRTTIIELLNKASRELHKQLECNRIYRECTLVVAPDKVVSLPPFVGEPKGVRMHSTELPVDVHALSSPRYVVNTLGYQYKNWRDVGISPVHTLPANIGPLTIETPDVKDPADIVTITGETNNAANAYEDVSVDAASVASTMLFTENIKALSSKSRTRTCNITIKDADGNEIAILYNDQPKTRYKIIDVSKVFWPVDTAASESLMDVLYKLPFTLLVNDNDSFFAGDDFDESWYEMTMYFFFLPIADKLNQAMTHRAAALDFLKSAKEGAEGHIVKKLSFGRNKYYDHFGRRVPTNFNQSLDYYNK